MIISEKHSNVPVAPSSFLETKAPREAPTLHCEKHYSGDPSSLPVFRATQLHSLNRNSLGDEPVSQTRDLLYGIKVICRESSSVHALALLTLCLRCC